MKKGILNTILVLLLVQAVKAQTPVADFSGSVLSGCAPLRVNFKDLSTGDPKYWDWEFTDGGSFSQLANQQNPGITFNQPGTYSVTLVVRNQSGVNAVTKTGYITVYPSPTADFRADITTACLPATIQFTGTASTTVGTISEWSWDFGDGGTSNQQNPQHTYTETGYFNVALTVTSSNGCSRRVSRGRYIRMVSGIVADFVNTPSAACTPPFGVAFTNESSGPGRLTYTWNFGNGSTADSANPVVNFATDGDYAVQLIAQSNYGCKDTVQKTVTVTTYAAGFSSPDSSCLVEPVHFANTSAAGGASLLWDFGDGTQSSEPNPVKTYGAAGSYTVKLISNYAHCSDSVSKTIKITPKAAVDFTAVNNLGCGVPLEVQFQNNTPGAVSWLWDFGDGNTSTAQNPSHTYTSVASYDVTLTVTTANGCGNTITKPRFVRVIPTTVRIITAVDEGCVNAVTVHPVTEIRTVDAIDSYLWDFGDGITSTNPTPTHTYTGTGVFPMKVTVTTVDGCTVTTPPHYVRVGTPPSTADFTFDNTGNCVSDSVKFYGTSSGANEWLWDFGDGETSDEQNPVHLFRDTGMVTVKLTPFNNGCPGPAITKADIFHKDAPVANFGFEVNCSNPLLVKFTDSSIVDASLGTPIYQWDFGDGQASTDQHPPGHTFPASGQYNVQLTVINGSCTAVYVRQIDLFSVNADFTLPSAAMCKNTQLVFNSVEDTSRIASYTWFVDAEAVRNEPSFDTVFQSPGNRLLELTVTDKNGCSATESKTLQVKGPTAQFTSFAAVNCGSDAVSFTDESTPSGTAIAEWLWDFGDNTTQTFSAPPFTHQYADTGTYAVKLTVKDADGCVDAFTLADPVKISAPKAYFGAVQTLFCPGMPLAFNDSSSGKGLTYAWDFGNGQTATAQNPSNIYADGKYSVKLVVTDSLGCSDSLTRTDYIDVRTPVAAFEATDTSSTCQLLEAKFFNRSENYESFYWDFGDSTNSTLAEPRHFYDVYGSYVVKLYVTGYGGCVDSAVGEVNVYDPLAYTRINYTVPPSPICNEVPIAFNIVTPPGTKFQFAFGDGDIDSSGQTVLNHLYDYPNTYRPSVALVDAQDCRVSVSGPTPINVRGAVPAFNIDKKQFCDSGTIFVTNYTISNDPVVSQLWNFGDGQTSIDKTPPAHIFPQAGLYPVSLTATTQSGCERTYTDTVRVYRTPNPVIAAGDITCISRAIAFNGSLAQPPDTAILWNWSFGDGRTSAERNNTISYDNPGNYTVTLTATNNFGCKDMATHPLMVAPLPVITTQNVVIPVGGEIVMPVSYSSGISHYTWTPPDGLSCTSCPAPLAKPKVTTTYHIQVTDSNTCSNAADIMVEVVCKTENYFVPNTFSPNGDGMNDVFYPRGRGLASVQSMKIYNRWGQLVFDRRNFSANDPTKGWDGKMGNQAVPPDVYVYMVEFICENAQIVPMKGNVTLIR
ncbi:MAG TPA: PKD domain-containing protein [Agriterribacter sp.]|uniref:PKD domain-containing protein n=1 Tax=Agriterribacter sp. TaxID=2821509 RepID=UPI002C2F2F5F|nr:PKD domain-containing protein [Agriterribacter sp.]HRQ17991.1 PKD domain-containing protein [Agriterribacter sp.]